MKGKTMKRILTVMMVGIMFVMLVLPSRAAESIKPSEVNYEASFRDANLIFLGNKKKVERKINKHHSAFKTIKKVFI